MTAATAESYILCLVANTTYALRSDDVRHMEMVEQVTPVPNASAYLEGVVFSRGQIVPVLNLRTRFGFDRVAHDLRTRLVVVQVADRCVGLIVDSAREFVRIPQEAIQPPSHAITNLSTNYLEGVANLGDRIVLVLNVARIVETTEPAGQADETRV
jgi:purine-binding chemotaxis protein CheW